MHTEELQEGELPRLTSKFSGARSFADVAAIAQDDCRKEFPTGAYMVIGPVLNGGIIKGNTVDVYANVEILRTLILMLRETGLPVFSQFDYKGPLDHFRIRWEQETKTHRRIYCPLIFSEFYGPLLRSSSILGAHFSPRSNRSRVAKNARILLKKEDKEIFEIEEDLYREALRRVLH